MPREVTTFLMFEGHAEEAMTFYVSLFGGTVTAVEKYGPDGPGKEGSVKKADFTLAGHRISCIDSPAKHAFTFTPSVSLFVTCGDETELDRSFAALSAGGVVMMPPGNYGFSRKFTWVSDRFGVSWQLNLEWPGTCIADVSGSIRHTSASTRAGR
jgi:predicted 3-demethylubiquinone-9 3-methyltransferase (glyoxalase superfamily)